jgi:hypothetical protein
MAESKWVMGAMTVAVLAALIVIASIGLAWASGFRIWVEW